MSTMEALYFLKLWRPTTTTSTNQKDQHHRPSSGNSTDTSEIATALVDIADDNEFKEEEDDSFFELELTMPDFDNIKCDNRKNTNQLDKDSNIFDSNHGTPHNKAGKFPPPTLSVSPTDLLSKRKILPIEPITSKPQSPISLLKSAPRFRVLMFKKSKSTEAQKTGDEAELKGVFVDDTPKNKKKQERNLFTIKFKLKEATNIPIFTRDNSLTRQISSDESLSSNDSSKRFSKEAIQKCLKLIKTLYIKGSKKQNEKPKLSATSPSCSPAVTLPSYSPKKEKQGSIPAGIRLVCKHLGKSKSASAATAGLPSTVGRRDDSLLLQHDGIQGAILHCKKSFNSSSRDSSLLSRFASDPLHDRSMASPRTSHEDNGIN